MFQTGANKWARTTLAAEATRSPTQALLPPERQARLRRRRRPTDSAFDEYVSDPANPVPYRPRPIPPDVRPGSEWPTWMVDDQRFAHGPPGRADVTRPSRSTEDVIVAGDDDGEAVRLDHAAPTRLGRAS